MAAAAGLSLVPISTSYAAVGPSDSCAPDQYTEQGVCAPMVSTGLAQTMSAQATAEAQAKAQAASSLAASANFNLDSVVNMTIFKEGQGNGKKSYTCGPSATRNMVYAMYKAKTGAYNDFGEGAFETWEGTTTNGTSTANIAATLNNHFGSLGSWSTHKATSKDDYINWVSADTQTFHESVIVAVDTEELAYFNNKALDHINLDYGYDSSGATKYIYKAEEWDPIFTYGSSSYGNPYGKHKIGLTQAFNAENKTSYHFMVV
jgi:hypothetical protein